MWIALKQKPTGTTLELTDLYEGDRYEFRVTAENKIGPSKPSEPSRQIVAKSKYGEWRLHLKYQRGILFYWLGNLVDSFPCFHVFHIVN